MDIARTAHVRRVTLRPAPSLVAMAVALLCQWDARFRQRRALAALDPRQRADLGLSLHDIAAEVEKPLWRA
jgi:uncharacterized protein YjiS (DUF1127 family)